MKPAATMPAYLSKEIGKVWRRICIEFSSEWPMLCDRWKIFLGGLFFQYVHGIGAHSAHFLHQPADVLHDMGFYFLPELGKHNAWMSEYAFLSIILPFVIWSFHPFVFHQKRVYTVLLWTQILTCLSICQLFRMLSFTATQLPGPNYHCRLGSPIATLPPLTRIEDLILLDIGQTARFGCGDLIFSSHMTFSLTFVLTYARFGHLRFVKHIGFLLAVIQSCLIVASRKHYTVDVVVAWYTVPLVFYFVDRHLAEYVGQGDSFDRLEMSRGIDKGSSLPLLPIAVDLKSGRDKSGPTTPHANGHHELPAWHSIGVLAVTMSTRTSPSESERRQRMGSNGHYVDDTMRDEDSPNGHISV